MTSSAGVADLNENIFGRTICPLSFVVIALIVPELRGGGGIRTLRDTRLKLAECTDHETVYFTKLDHKTTWSAENTD